MAILQRLVIVRKVQRIYLRQSTLARRPYHRQVKPLALKNLRLKIARAKLNHLQNQNQTRAQQL